MSRRSEKAFADEWDTMVRRLAAGKPQPRPPPKQLPLTKIRLNVAVFQHRDRRGGESDAHVRRLAAVVRKGAGRTLDPIKVWWDGRAWVCIDGHHRYDAYRAAGYTTTHAVPVEAFEGSASDAISAAASGNTKDKLAMSTTEKSNTAWRLTVATDMSKAEVAKIATVSDSTVATMRRVHALLKARSDTRDDLLAGRATQDHRSLSWADAKRLAQGREAPDFDRDAANEKKAQEMAMSLRKALGKEGAKYPEILARALEIYDTRLMDRLVEWWANHDEADDAVEPVAESNTSDF